MIIPIEARDAYLAVKSELAKVDRAFSGPSTTELEYERAVQSLWNAVNAIHTTRRAMRAPSFKGAA